MEDVYFFKKSYCRNVRIVHCGNNSYTAGKNAHPYMSVAHSSKFQFN